MPSRATDPDPYSVLGVPRTADAAEIRTTYRALSARFHPDRHQGNPLEELAAARMKELNRAYEILSDPRRRAVYDAGGNGDAPVVSGPRTSGFPTPGNKLGKWLGLVLLLPVLLRFGIGAARVLARTLVAAAEALGSLRGTPYAAAGVLLATGLLTFALFRRRRIKKG